MQPYYQLKSEADFAKEGKVQDQISKRIEQDALELATQDTHDREFSKQKLREKRQKRKLREREEQGETQQVYLESDPVILAEASSDEHESKRRFAPSLQEEEALALRYLQAI